METVAAESILAENGVLQNGWLDSMPEGTFEKDDTGKLIQGDLADHKDIGSIAKSYLNKDKLLGTAIQPLAENATEEQKAAHRTKVGCPDKVEGYEIVKPTPPEGMEYDDELIKNASKFAHDKFVPKDVFEGLVKIVFDRQTETLKQMAELTAKAEAEKAAASDKVITDAENALKSEWGADYDKNLELANRFYDLPGDDATNKAFTELMAEKGLNSHPVVVKFMREAHKLVKEDEIPGTPGGGGKATVPGQLDYTEVVGHSGR
jgi:hypothetical protein